MPSRASANLTAAIATLAELSLRPDFASLGIEIKRFGRSAEFAWRIYAPLGAPAYGALCHCRSFEQEDVIRSLLIALAELRRQPAKKTVVLAPRRALKDSYRKEMKEKTC